MTVVSHLCSGIPKCLSVRLTSKNLEKQKIVFKV